MIVGINVSLGHKIKSLAVQPARRDKTLSSQTNFAAPMPAVRSAPHMLRIAFKTCCPVQVAAGNLFY